MRIKAPFSKNLLILVTVIAAWAYLSNVTFALRRESAALSKDLGVTQAQISEATTEMKTFDRRRKTAARNPQPFEWANHLLASLPRPYMVEMPLKFVGLFKDHGVENAEVRLSQLFPLRDISDHAIARWELRSRQGRVLPFGQALAAVENAFALGSVKSLSIQRVNVDGTCDIACVFETIVRP